MIVDFIQIKSFCTMEKRKDGYSSNQTMTSSFSFAAQLHCKCILRKEINEKLYLIKVMSSMIQAASRKQTL